MDVLIVAPTYDPHANAVAWGVEALGGSSSIVDYGFSPTRSTMSFRGDDQRFWIKAFDRLPRVLRDVRCLWVRRASEASFDDRTHEADRQYSGSSWKALHRSFSVLAKKQCDFVVNDPDFHSSAVLKPVQIAVASDVGLKVPATLISSDEDEITSFVGRNDDAGIRTIVKPLVHMKWLSDNGSIFNAKTSLVTTDDVTSSDVRSCPMVYQAEVVKKFEVRALVCGGSYVAARIAKQEGAAAVDWRLQRNVADLLCDRIDLPGDVWDKVRSYMRSMRLATASLDFIVDDEGNWIFLESNEGGNFLWLEVVNPNLPVLDMFCKFLMSRDNAFAYDGRRDVREHDFDRTVGLSYLEGAETSNPNGGTRPVLEQDTTR